MPANKILDLPDGTRIFTVYPGTWDAVNQMIVEPDLATARHGRLPEEVPPNDGIIFTLEGLYDTVVKMKQAADAKAAQPKLLVSKGDIAQDLARKAHV